MLVFGWNVRSKAKKSLLAHWWQFCRNPLGTKHQSVLTKHNQLGEIWHCRQPSLTRTVSLIQLTAWFWTDPARSKASGGISSIELCHLSQKGTLGNANLHFIMVSWHKPWSFLRAPFFFFASERMGALVVSGGRRVLNPMVAQCVQLSG